MADKNSFLGDMVQRSSNADAGTTKPSSEKIRPATTLTPPKSYDAQAFGILKMRLNEQRSQLKGMSDFSEDTAVKLNDIYEILKDMKPAAVTAKQDAIVSPIDNFFRDDGYIPVMVLNMENYTKQDQGNGAGIDSPGASWWKIIAKTGLAGAISLLAGGGGSISPSDQEYDSMKQDFALAESLAKQEKYNEAANVMRKHADKLPPGGLISSPLSPEYWMRKFPSKKTRDELSRADQFGRYTTEEMDYIMSPPSRKDGGDGQSIWNKIENLFGTGRGIAPAPRYPQSGGAGFMFGPGNNGLAPEDLLLSSYGQTQQENDANVLTARRIVFSGKEMSFESDKFEFNSQSGMVAPQSDIVNASYTGPGGDAPSPSTPTASQPQTPSLMSPALSGAMGAMLGPIGSIAATGMTALSSISQPNDVRSGIIEAANELGMNPVDLATIISYETGGTFDPTKAGPTTKWGQHRGLIQFGEPQAQQYGVDWNDPIGSQLGANGAIVKYFRDHGWKPGMSMLDAYSIVNAGAPGRYGASDTAAGGAPGTVFDKVTGQMGGHRVKAQELIGNAVPSLSSSLQTGVKGFFDRLFDLSSSVDMNLNTPKPANATTVMAPNYVNVQSPAYAAVDEPLAAIDEMFNRLLDETFMFA